MASSSESAKAKVTRFVEEFDVHPPPQMVTEETIDSEGLSAARPVRRPSIFGGPGSASPNSDPMRFVEEIGDVPRSNKSGIWAGSQSPNQSSFLARAAVATRTIVGLLHQRPKTVFDNAEELKKRVDRAIHDGEETYDVETLYWETGCSQKLARSVYFQNMTLAAILLYAAWLSYDADTNQASTLVKADIQYQVVEHLFCFYFFFELVVRFLAFRRKRSACTDGWFMFDFLLVLMGVAEVWVMSIVLVLTKSEDASLGNSSSLRLIRLLRLSRLARTARLLRAAPELLIMVKGMIAAARSMLTTGVLIFAVLYVFGIAMKQAAEGTDGGNTYFKSVLDSMFMLLLHATLLDSPGEVIDTLEENYLAAVIFVVVIALSALLLLNMLIGVMCEVVSGVSQTEREAIAEAFVRDKVQQIMDERGLSGRITQHELLGILNDSRSTRLLSEAHVDVMGLVDIADYLFQSDLNGQEFDRELSFDEFLRVIMSLRGSNTVTLKDIMDLRRTLHANQTEIRNVVSNLEERMRRGFSLSRMHSGISATAGTLFDHGIGSEASRGSTSDASEGLLDSCGTTSSTNSPRMRPPQQVTLPGTPAESASDFQMPALTPALVSRLRRALAQQAAAEARHAAARQELEAVLALLAPTGSGQFGHKVLS